jgi:hypothetical protein
MPFFYETTKRFNIKYELDGGTNNENNPTSYISGEEKDILDLTREGYEFVEWKEGNKILKTDVGDKTFTAVWKKIEYKIEAEVINGKINNSINTAYDENVNVEVDEDGKYIINTTYGGDVKVEYGPNDGYILSKITVDGKEVDIKEFKDSYEFKDIRRSHKIKVEYINAAPYTPADNPKTGPIAILPVILLGTIALIVYKKTRKKNVISKI